MDFSNLRHRSIVLILILFVLLVYANSLWNSFVWDDFLVVVDNNFIKSWNNFPSIFTKSYLTSASDIRYLGANRLDSGELTYRPLVTISYFIDYSLWKLNPFGYHLTNIIFHILNVLLFYFLACLIAKNRQVSLLASLLFVVHPINVEAVNCISLREDLLAFLFFVSSLILFIKYDNFAKGKRYFRFAPIILFLLALFSKEMALTLPLVLILYDYYFTYDQSIKKVFANFKSRYLVYIIAALSYLWVLFFHMANTQRILPQYPGGNFYTNLLTMSKVVAIYIKSLVLPVNIFGTIPDFDFEPSFVARTFLSPAVLSSLFLIILCLGFVFRTRKTSPLISFSILWFFVTLIPVYNIIPLDNIMAWRYLYIPSAGFCLLAALLVFKLKKIRKDVIILLLAFYLSFTVIGNMFWKNSLTLWLETQRHYPKNALVYNNIGFGYSDIGQADKAIEFFNKATAAKPDYALAYYNLGLSYASINNFKQAIPSYEKAIAIYNDFAQAYHDLAFIYLTRKDPGDIKKAIVLYKKAIETYPDFAEAYNNLGVAYKELGNIGEAIPFYKKAIEINPKYTGAYYNLALAYKQKGESESANKYYDKAKELGFSGFCLGKSFVSHR
ncbi:MAG: tetratricopeptide repeat protein [Candidatus Omnitrophica bacterium]|nr:tetratricopeptide repeat protein [Candidatus Omnitrophota bacterium]